MPSNYTGDPDGAGVGDPFVVQIPSDGDKRKVASVNPAFEQLADAAAAFTHYGARTDQNNGFDGQNTFSDVVSFNASVTFAKNTRRPQPAALANVADQTINPNTQQTNYYFGILATNPPALGAASRIVRLDTSNVFDGDWVKIVFKVAVGAGVWVFRRGADDTQDICSLDSTGEVRDEAEVEFERVGGLWKLANEGRAIIPGTYA